MLKVFSSSTTAGVLCAILLGLWNLAAKADEPVEYFYNEKTGICSDAKGVVGRNSDYFGQCGEFKYKVYIYAKMSWPIPPDLRGADLTGSDLTSASLAEGLFNNAQLTNSTLYRADLSHGVFANATLKNVNWGSSFLYAANFEKTNLTNADFKTADLVGTNFKGAQLEGADFSRCRMNVSDLSDANLENAKLVGTYLYFANLSKADLSEADMRGSYLLGVDMSGCDPTGTKFTGAYYDDGTILPFDSAEAKKRGMIHLAGGTPATNDIPIAGNSDGTCSPTMIDLKVGKKVNLVLKGSSSMFTFEAKDLGINIMSMPNQPGSQTMTPSKQGNFPFSCGATGKETKGTIMVM